MRPLHQFIVKSTLPKRLERLQEITMNYWWCWNTNAKDLFHEIDKELFIECNHNPVLFMNRIDQNKLDNLSQDKDFLEKFDSVISDFDDYMLTSKWMKSSDDNLIAYFSPEYGINESFPNYSGGLGVLSGDHMKSSSDLGLNLVGIGLLYQEGYFRQRLTQNGWQNEVYKYNDFFTMPLKIVKDNNGDELIIDVDFPDTKIYARVWELHVGLVRIFLLDTNIDQNSNADHKKITNRLYGGDRNTRIQQEIILGIGGMRALYKMGLEPSVVHINEGHAAFALLERTKHLMKIFNISFGEAKEITQASSVFTTHTPVPAGNEEFDIQKIEYYFTKYIEELGLNIYDLYAMGRQSTHSMEDKFSMTVLGLKMSAYHNGVSKLHGKISREMWQNIWPNYNSEETPIDHVTNGIHTKTWLAGEFEAIFDKHIGSEWRIDTDSNDVWEKAKDIPDDLIWETKRKRREDLLEFVKMRLGRSVNGYLNQEQMRKLERKLDPNALTIGFARRFATYKRAHLLFTNMDKFLKIFNNEEKPVQILIAGKAHPHDHAGKETIQGIIQKVKDHGLEHKVIFIEDYDMVVGRMLVKGCDVWLNNPIRPLEASGTSGMKAAINGGLNFSILDGWWDEGFNHENGFSIGTGEEYINHDEQTNVESGELYDVLEHEVVKIFYDRDENGLPKEWIAKMKNAIATCSGTYSTHRMVKDYTTKFYIPANERFHSFVKNKAKVAVDLHKWKSWVEEDWQNISFTNTNVNHQSNIDLKELVEVECSVNLSNLKAEDVKVQVYFGDIAHDGEIVNSEYRNLEYSSSDDNTFTFKGNFKYDTPGKKGFTFRIVPSHADMTNSREMYLCKWA